MINTKSVYDFQYGTWSELTMNRLPALLLYFRVDGSVFVRDWATAGRIYSGAGYKWGGEYDPTAIQLTQAEMWNGTAPKTLFDGVSRVEGIACRGLIEDWITWQAIGGSEFDALVRVLKQLSPNGSEALELGKPTRVSRTDRRLHPTLKFPYGEIPISIASAGMKRVVSIAYLLVWAWSEHVQSAKIGRSDPVQNIVVLIDEPEMHLHPRWQRTVLPSLLAAIGELSSELKVQILVSTHSPLVLASMEPIFDHDKDKLLELFMDEETGHVKLFDRPWANRGDVTGWLVSDTFGLGRARSLPAEKAIDAAYRFMRGEGDKNPEGLRTEGEIDQELDRLLAGRDPFWARWIGSKTRKGPAK